VLACALVAPTAAPAQEPVAELPLINDAPSDRDRGGNAKESNGAANHDGLAPGIQVAQADSDSGEVTDVSAFQAAVAIEGAMIEAIARAEKSVVAIARVRRQDDQPLDLSVNQFGRLQITELASPGTPEFIPNEYATGVVVGADGLILTANHVLQDNCDYWVTTADRRTFKVVRVQGADPRSDLAVLQIEATDLVPITFGDGSKLRKGQIVLALGNPYAIARDGQASASWGIVANLTRKDGPSLDSSSPKPSLHQYGTMIQTDARLNLGTSGGALLNLKGEMVGLTVSLAAASGYEQSAGFAIPVDDTFLRAVQTLKAGREMEYGFLGVAVNAIALVDRQRGHHGVLVTAVVGATPAKQYGVKDGDLITHVDGQPIYDQDQFMLAIGKLPAGGGALLTVEREGRVRTIEIGHLAKYFVPEGKIVTAPRSLWRGMQVDYVTATRNFQAWSQQGDLDPQGSVLVTEVEESSPAWNEGLRPDMRITHVNGERVTSPGEFAERVAKISGPVKLKIYDPQNKHPERTVPPEA
jgi:S1-C subfamily serine protease